MWARAPLLSFLLLAPLLLFLMPNTISAQQVILFMSLFEFVFLLVFVFVFCWPHTSVQQVINLFLFRFLSVFVFVLASSLTMKFLILRRQRREKRARGVNAILTNTIYHRMLMLTPCSYCKHDLYWYY